jgi:hypothetical protein
MDRGIVKVSFTGTDIRFVDYGGYESRNKSTIRMIADAWKAHRPSKLIFKQITIWTEDGFNPSCDFSYAIERREDLPRCIPHFMFESWPEVGIMRYSDTFRQMIEAGSVPPKDPRVFWIGTATNALRSDACDMSKQFPHLMDFRMMSWNRNSPDKLFENTPSYVSLVDHCRYRGLVDLGAGGFSARLPLLFASGRPVILADRQWESWFYWNNTLRPWIHYIPGGSTAETVREAVEWLFANPEEAEAIGRRGQQYALEHFTYESVLKRCANLLWNKK